MPAVKPYGSEAAFIEDITKELKKVARLRGDLFKMIMITIKYFVFIFPPGPSNSPLSQLKILITNIENI